MIEKQLQEQVKEGYEKINNQWLKFHVRLLALSCLVTFLFEIIMFFVISYIGGLSHSVPVYWMKFILVPGSLSFGTVFLGYLIFRKEKLKITYKEYGISLLFVLYTFILSFSHSGFVAIMVSAIFPVLMTIMYESQRLSATTAVASFVLQFLSGYFIFWDPEKVLDNAYFVNLLILMTATFCSWITSFIMIRFIKLKRDIIMKNEMERYRLRKMVHIDGLTGVGNKTALEERLKQLSQQPVNRSYLVMLDIDCFKHINDNFGHVVGDEVLKHFGEGLRSIRANAFSFRYGGDEFCILFIEEDETLVKNELLELQEHIRRNLILPGKEKTVFFSAGVAGFYEDFEVNELLRRADVALYQSKKKAGFAISLYENL